MRTLGLVEWFGRYNSTIGRVNDYGYLTTMSGKPYYFHETKILCNEKSLIKAKTPVFFDLIKRPRAIEPQVENVQTIEEEEQYFKSLEQNDALGASYLYWIDLLFLYENGISCASYLEHISSEYFKKFRLLREFLSIEDRLEICSNLWANGQKTVKEEWMDSVSSVLSKKNTKDAIAFFKQIPFDAYMENTAFEQNLPICCKYQYWLNHYSVVAFQAAAVERLASLAKEDIYVTENTKEIPFYVLRNDEIWINIPNCSFKVDLLLRQLYQEPENRFYITDLADILKKHRTDNFGSFLFDKIPVDILKEPLIFAQLPPKNRVDLIYNLGNLTTEEQWEVISGEERVLFLMRMMKEGIDVERFNLEVCKEKEPLVYAIYVICCAKNHDEIVKKEAFSLFNKYFQNYIMERSYNSSDKVFIGSLLPKCSERYTIYCEAAFWPDKKAHSHSLDAQYRVYCPRNRKSKEQFMDPYECAISKPNLQLEWDEWSFLELFFVAGIRTELIGLKSYKYVPKMSGWLNRLEEIRERLVCSHCGAVMEPNFEYSKYSAVYQITVASCPSSMGKEDRRHDYNIYFNHCWVCGRTKLIDSRENQVQVEGFYLCLKCGNGPGEGSVYHPGIICPSCASAQMQHLKNSDKHESNIYKCWVCGHIIFNNGKKAPKDMYLEWTAEERFVSLIESSQLRIRGQAVNSVDELGKIEKIECTSSCSKDFPYEDIPL